MVFGAFPSAASTQTTPLAHLPLYFEAGQTVDATSQFLARGCNYEFVLSPTQTQLILSKPAGTGPAAALSSSHSTNTRMVTMNFVAANPQARIFGASELPGKINYLIGNDPAQWRHGVPTYATVEVESLYQGISLVYYGNQQQLEYDFTVAPGVNPGAIAIRFEGADKISVNPRGELILALGDDEIRHGPPVLYQMVAGKRMPIEGGYQLKDAQTVQFKVGRYDHRLPLIIDPVLTYSTYFGAKASDTAVAVKVDAAGSVYVAGMTLGNITNAPSGFQGGKIAGDTFVAKFDSTLTNLIFLTYLGGSVEDGAYDMALDQSNNIFLTGFTDSPDFPVFPANPVVPGLPNAGRLAGTQNTSVHKFPTDAFVTELDSTGAIVYSLYLGGTNQDVGQSIAVDNAGNAYVTGYTFSLDPTNDFGVPAINFPTTANPYQITTTSNIFHSTAVGNASVFVARIAAGGTSLDYSTFFGGNNANYGVGIAVNPQASDGIAYVTGFTTSTNFPTTASALQTNLNHSTNAAIQFNKVVAPSDAFLAKFDTTLGGTNSLVFSTLLGGTNADAGTRIVFDPLTGSVYLTGYTSSGDFPSTTTNVLGLYSEVGTNVGRVRFTSDVFLAKFDSTTNLLYSLVFGGTNSDVGWDVALDPASTTLGITGFTTSSNFPTVLTAGLLSSTNHGSNDVFVTLLTDINSSTPTVLYSVYLGGSGNDSGYGIALDSNTNAFVVGVSSSTNFPTLAPAGMSPFQSSQFSSNSVFLAKIVLTSFQINVTIDTVPTNLAVVVDGVTNIAPVSFNDFPGYPHTISTFLLQTNAGVRQVWSSWSDGAPLTHTIKPTSDGTFIATFEAPPPNTVAVITNGNGKVSPNYNQQALTIGQSFSMTAKPASGWLFNGWAGSIVTNNPTLTFVMADSLVFEANFIPSPFIPLAGTYAGLFSDTNGLAFQSSGFFSATINSVGSFSAKIQQAGKTHSFSSRFSNDGLYSNSIPRSGLSPLSVSLVLDLTGANGLTGTISDGVWTAELTANRAAGFTVTPASSYTLVIPGAADSSAQPGGDGFGSVIVNGLGNVSFNGTLADGTKISQRTVLSARAQWPFYASLYSGKGSIIGWLSFTNEPGDDLSGPLTWFKTPQPSTKFYPAGFTLLSPAIGSIYLPDYSVIFFGLTNVSPLLNLTNGQVVLENGNLTQPITNAFALSVKNKVTDLGANKLKLSFTTSSGLFHGSVVNPATSKTISFNGALLQKQTNGFGSFLGTNQVGRALLLPLP